MRGAGIMLATFLAVIAAASANAGTSAQQAARQTPTCGTGISRAGKPALSKGARCLLHAFTACHGATYRLSVYGVDTIATDDFSVANADGHCFVSVKTSLRVVPQAAKPGATAFCAALKAQSGDVVAVHCTGGTVSATVSLTGRT